MAEDIRIILPVGNRPEAVEKVAGIKPRQEEGRSVPSGIGIPPLSGKDRKKDRTSEKSKKQPSLKDVKKMTSDEETDAEHHLDIFT